MSLALTEEHQALAESVADFLENKKARSANRALLEAVEEPLPSFWAEVGANGWLGLHVAESHGGSGYGMAELAIVAEQFGRTAAPGPFVPTTVASAFLSAHTNASDKLAGLADGSMVGSFTLTGGVSVTDGKATGTATVLSGAQANVVVAVVGNDVAVIDTATGTSVATPPNLDPSRRSSRLTFADAPAVMVSGAAAELRAIAQLVLSAEAIGVAREATVMGSAYSKVRLQFGRPIAMYQGVKHHCANMLVATELATATVWDAARAHHDGADQFHAMAAMAATLAGTAADLCANLNTQVHGGIAITWEHDAHLLMRRATMLRTLLETDSAANQATDAVRSGFKRVRNVELPPSAEAMRADIRAYAQSLSGRSEDEQKASLIETGYVQPHWPKPFGRDASPVEQLVIEQEFTAAGVKRPSYGITGWNILTLIQHANDDQVARWVLPALRHDVIWCQLFSEPDAGSDAAGIKTRGTRVDGGWLVNGQKVWTSGAHYSGMGLATIRTNPDVPKHQGITMMCIDMHAKGVEVRPLKMTTGNSEFNEVFFNDVFVPDDDVVGPVDSGWTVARATLGNESVSIGTGEGGMALPPQMLIALHDANPSRVAGAETRIGRYIANKEAMAALNMRAIFRAVVGGGPGPEGAVTKLVLSELGHDAADMYSRLLGPDAAFLEGQGLAASGLTLMHRGMSIAGGTSEIKRNQIGERILGLPRDPLLN